MNIQVFNKFDKFHTALSELNAAVTLYDKAQEIKKPLGYDLNNALGLPFDMELPFTLDDVIKAYQDKAAADLNTAIKNFFDACQRGGFTYDQIRHDANPL